MIEIIGYRLLIIRDLESRYMFEDFIAPEAKLKISHELACQGEPHAENILRSREKTITRHKLTLRILIISQFRQYFNNQGTLILEVDYYILL